MTVKDVQPESAALLRRVFHGHDAAWPANLSENVFLKDVALQGMAPLLFYTMKDTTCTKSYANWPPDLLTCLRETAMRQAAAELLLEIDLRSLLNAFAAIEVQPLLLKGTPLSYTHYPESGLRPRCDTDLLLPESARSKAAVLMNKLGYAALHGAAADYISSQMSYSKQQQKMRYSYDIHWRISNNNIRFSREFADSGLFAHAVDIPSLGKNARTLNRVDSLLFSCFHRAGHFSHSGDRLIWLYDIHLLSQALTEQENEILYDKAKRLEIMSLCVDALHVANVWFDTVLPHTLFSQAHNKENSSEFSGIFLESGGRRTGIKNHALLELRGLSTWRERFFYLVQNAFPPAGYMLWRYGQETQFALPWLYAKRFAEAIYIFLRK